jgi:hypothetical protein
MSDPPSSSAEATPDMPPNRPPRTGDIALLSIFGRFASTAALPWSKSVDTQVMDIGNLLPRQKKVNGGILPLSERYILACPVWQSVPAKDK